MMIESRGARVFATIDDLSTRAREMVDRAQARPVYLLQDGEPVAAIVSIATLEHLQDALEDGEAEKRLRAVRDGSDALLDEADFWERADAVMEARR